MMLHAIIVWILEKSKYMCVMAQLCALVCRVPSMSPAIDTFMVFAPLLAALVADAWRTLAGARPNQLRETSPMFEMITQIVAIIIYFPVSLSVGMTCFGKAKWMTDLQLAAAGTRMLFGIMGIAAASARLHKASDTDTPD